MNRKERKLKQLEFEKEIKELFSKGISVVDISQIKKITRARVYQILGLNKGKKE